MKFNTSGVNMDSQTTTQKKIKVALIIDEFFGALNTPYGGYGFLARNLIAKYLPNKDIELDVLLGKGKSRFFAEMTRIDNVDVFKLPRKKFFASRWLATKNYDIYLSIELTYSYVLECERNKDKKLILWIQDPRPKYEWDEINTVKLFTETSYYNQKIYNLVHDWYKSDRVRFISQAYFLNQKAKDLYRLDESVPIQYLPNPIEIDYSFDLNSYTKKNMIIFLGRLESVKRGWLFCEIAKLMPEYEFYVLGQTFREKDQNQSIFVDYQAIPNLHFVGHIEGEEKNTYLKNAKILVNTSIHEALPVSFIEALSYGTLLVSNRNPDNLTSKFGEYVGDVLGDGFDKVNLYVDAINTIMKDDNTRHARAKDAIQYVKDNHNLDDFRKNMRDIIKQSIKH